MPEIVDRHLADDRDRRRVHELGHVGAGESGADDDAAILVDDVACIDDLHAAPKGDPIAHLAGERRGMRVVPGRIRVLLVPNPQAVVARNALPRLITQIRAQMPTRSVTAVSVSPIRRLVRRRYRRRSDVPTHALRVRSLARRRERSFWWVESS